MRHWQHPSGNDNLSPKPDYMASWSPDESMSFMGDDFSSDDAESSLSSSAHPNKTGSSNTFHIPAPLQLPQSEDLSFPHLGAPGQSVYRGGSLESYHFQVGWWSQPEDLSSPPLGAPGPSVYPGSDVPSYEHSLVNWPSQQEGLSSPLLGGQEPFAYQGGNCQYSQVDGWSQPEDLSSSPPGAPGPSVYRGSVAPSYEHSLANRLPQQQELSSPPLREQGPSAFQGESTKSYQYPQDDWWSQWEDPFSPPLGESRPSVCQGSGVLSQKHPLVDGACQHEDLPSLPLGKQGPSVYQGGSIPGYQHTPTDWSSQQEYKPVATCNITALATPARVRHEYHRLPGTEDKNLDEWLKGSELSKPGRRTFQCTWPDCTSAPFTGKSQAYTHVCKHLGIKKLYVCVACHTQFATRGAAKRHSESQEISFTCSICHTVIKRKDYWRKHEQNCASKH